MITCHPSTHAGAVSPVNVPKVCVPTFWQLTPKEVYVFCHNTHDHAPIGIPGESCVGDASNIYKKILEMK